VEFSSLFAFGSCSRFGILVGGQLRSPKTKFTNSRPQGVNPIVSYCKTKEQKVIADKIDELRIETQKLEAIYQKKINDLEELKKSKAFAGELKTEKALI
jgi:hypothetical protein